MNHDSRDAHVMSGAYVLHALDPEERAAVEAAMAGSEELRSEIAELSDTAVELGLAVPTALPPAALRARVLALATNAPQFPPEAEAEASVEPASDVRSVGPVERAAQQRWFLRPTVLVAAAAAAAVLFVGGLGVDRVLNPDTGMSQSPQFAALVAAPDTQQGRGAVAGGGTATVYSSAHLGESAVALDGVAQPTGGRVLQVWRLSGGTATSLGFYPANGPGYVLVQHALDIGQRVAVTVEPAGGSSHPTTAPLVTVTA